MATEFWFEVTLILLLILVNGFFAGSEMAIIAMRRSRIDQLVHQGQVSAHVVGQLKDDPARFLATLQIGVTVVGSLASVIGGASAHEYLGPLFHQSGIAFVQQWSEVLSLGVVVVVISYLSLVAGELVPKSLALRYPEQVACAVARPLALFSRLFSVVVRLLTASSRVLLPRSGTNSIEALVSEEEVKYLIREGAENGVFDDTEKDFIHGVFTFANTSVRKVLTPRTEVCAVEARTSCDVALQKMIDSGFSRLPVYEGDLERIIGIVHIKELLRTHEQRQTLSLHAFVHPAYFVPDSMQISHLLRELQVRRAHMAVVINEFGTVIGVATIEDVLEEIVGEIRDEFDQDEDQPVQEIGESVLLVEGGVTLNHLKEQYHLPVVETASYRTLAGLLLSRLERIPKGGECVVHDDYLFTIEEMNDHRIVKVRVEKLNMDTHVAETQQERGMFTMSSRLEGVD